MGPGARRFAQALAQNDPTTLAPLLADDVSVQAFDAKTVDAVRLLSRTRGTLLIGSRAYVHAPARMAADIVEAFVQAQAPDEIKRYMTPANDSQMVRANTAAAKWLTESLSAKPGDLVGVVVFWRPPSGAQKLAEGLRPEIVFVLVKGSLAGPAARIDAIAFGNPQQRPALSSN